MSARPTETVVALSHGLWLDGRPHLAATIRPLNGGDEVLIAELGEGSLPAERASVLLASVVQSIGELHVITVETVRQLTIGDRERLLLALLAGSFGRLAATVRCTGKACGELFELPVDPDEIARSLTPGDAAPMHEVDATLGELPVHIRFRLPDGTAQEVAAREASNDLSRAGTALLRASIIEVTGPCGEILDTASTLDALREPLEEAWARLDPAAGLVTTVVCPLCDTTVEVLFDSFSLLAAELRYTSSILLEVHRLASAYHWTEAEILALPTRRRRGYLSLIDKGVAA